MCTEARARWWESFSRWEKGRAGRSLLTRPRPPRTRRRRGVWNKHANMRAQHISKQEPPALWFSLLRILTLRVFFIYSGLFFLMNFPDLNPLRNPGWKNKLCCYLRLRAAETPPPSVCWAKKGKNWFYFYKNHEARSKLLARISPSCMWKKQQRVEMSAPIPPKTQMRHFARRRGFSHAMLLVQGLHGGLSR